jgi:hypothetical protein
LLSLENNTLQQPEKNSGKTLFLHNFETELPNGTIVQSVTNSCFVAFIGHQKPETQQKFNGVVTIKKGTIYTDTDTTKGCIAKELKVDQRFVFEKNTQVTLKKGTEVKLKEPNINITLNEDLDVYISYN